MFSESHYLVRRCVRFLLLPYCYLRLVNWPECTKSRWAVAKDFLYIFFVLGDYPDNYGACRLWERPRSDWPKFYGSNYNPLQRSRLRREVHPIVLERAFQDKEVCDGLCRGLGIPVPETVGTLQPGEDISAKINELFGRIDSNRLIIKPIRGHAGLGVALATRADGLIKIKSQGVLLSPEQYEPAERCIVQHVVVQSEVLSAIAPASLNTLRLLTMLTRSSEVIVIGASMRFGVGESFVDNWSAGGIAVGVDHERGILLPIGYDKRGNRFTRHPISKVVFKDFCIPNWGDAVALGRRVQRAFPFFRLLGMDIGFTPSGVVLIEINSDADLVFQEQTSGPLLSTRQTWDAFNEYQLLYNRQQANLFAARTSFVGNDEAR